MGVLNRGLTDILWSTFSCLCWLNGFWTEDLLTYWHTLINIVQFRMANLGVLNRGLIDLFIRLHSLTLSCFRLWLHIAVPAGWRTPGTRGVQGEGFQWVPGGLQNRPTRQSTTENIVSTGVTFLSYGLTRFSAVNQARSHQPIKTPRFMFRAKNPKSGRGVFPFWLTE